MNTTDNIRARGMGVVCEHSAACPFRTLLITEKAAHRLTASEANTAMARLIQQRTALGLLVLALVVALAWRIR